jgi:hypothetical protein
MMHDATMAKQAAITVRIPMTVKQRLEAQARRERRSLSAQAATCLARAVENEPAPVANRGGKLLGLYAGTRVPMAREFSAVRRMLWGSLGRAQKRRGA